MRSKEFRWNDWNMAQATKHGCTLSEVESIIRGAHRGFPRKHGNGEWLVIGRGVGGRMVEVIYVLDADETIYVIHAMPLTARRRRRGRQ